MAAQPGRPAAARPSVVVAAILPEDAATFSHSPKDQVLRVLTISGLTGIGLVFENQKTALEPAAGAA
jgi:hypothetical protein